MELPAPKNKQNTKLTKPISSICANSMIASQQLSQSIESLTRKVDPYSQPSHLWISGGQDRLLSLWQSLPRSREVSMVLRPVLAKGSAFWSETFWLGLGLKPRQQLRQRVDAQQGRDADPRQRRTEWHCCVHRPHRTPWLEGAPAFPRGKQGAMTSLWISRTSKCSRHAL